MPKEIRIPFHRDSVIRTAFEMCLKGTTETEILDMCQSFGADGVRMLRIMRRGTTESGRVLWQLIERKGKMKIPQFIDKTIYPPVTHIFNGRKHTCRIGL